jgi:hydroxymethylpyrimidine/phosphomethylpyrimidine kinase
MSKKSNLPVALTIAGSDSGGGAGIQADLKTFAALGVHGTSAITCITAQNPDRVFGIQACRPEMVRQQIEAVFDGLRPDAVKTGMLFSTEIIRVVAQFFKHRGELLIVDPVMVSTSGSRLLKPAAIKTMARELLPLALLVTPNLDEAAVLTGEPLKSVEDMRQAARKIRELYGCAALVKGGHLGGMKEAVDIFYDGETELLLAAPFVKGLRTHGTGCTYSAAITAFLAAGVELTTSVVRAKEHITQAIVRSRKAAGYNVLSNFSEPKFR